MSRSLLIPRRYESDGSETDTFVRRSRDKCVQKMRRKTGSNGIQMKRKNGETRRKETLGVSNVTRLQSMKEETKLIVCRATGRPLIFPNVIEGVYTYFENWGKKKKRKRKTRKRQWTGRGGERTEEKGRRKKEWKKTSTMQLWFRIERVSGRHPCSGGVLLAGFRGVEIPCNVWDVCVDSFNPLAVHTLAVLYVCFRLSHP